MYPRSDAACSFRFHLAKALLHHVLGHVSSVMSLVHADVPCLALDITAQCSAQNAKVCPKTWVKILAMRLPGATGKHCI